MDALQIKKYELSKKYLTKLKGYTKALPFNIQEFGGGRSALPLENTLEHNHVKMYEEIARIIQDNIEKTQRLIEKI